MKYEVRVADLRPLLVSHFRDAIPFPQQIHISNVKKTPKSLEYINKTNILK